MREREICTYTIVPERDENCSNTAIWEVHWTEGSGHYSKSVKRCNDHVAATVSTITSADSMTYPYYRFAGITHI